MTVILTQAKNNKSGVIMKKYIATILLTISIFLLGTSALAKSYVDGSKPLASIKDVNRQGEAWAMCSAAYDVMAGLFAETQPATAQRLSEYANGAEAAVAMTIVMKSDDSEMTVKKFNATWVYAKVAMVEWPKTALTTIQLDAEMLGDEGADEFLENLTATVKICIENLEGQQIYIDTFREFIKSGMFKLPEN
jgi:hypothetical protein